MVFHLKAENDQIFPLHPDELPGRDRRRGGLLRRRHHARRRTSSTANAFGGPYAITSYDFNKLSSSSRTPTTRACSTRPRTTGVILSYFADSSNLKLAVQEGDIDVAYRTLSATDVEDLRGNDNVKVTDGPGGEIRYIVFNFDTQPYGATTPEADPAKALAVRQAVADLVDRQAISDQVYKGTYTPLYSLRARGLRRRHRGARRTSTATATADPTPTRRRRPSRPPASRPRSQLSLQYNPDHYGPSSGDEYAMVKDQLEKDGLFAVDLKSTEWVQYSEGPHGRRVPGLPARLVPGLLRRRQLPDAVLPHGQLPGEPLQRRRRSTS